MKRIETLITRAEQEEDLATKAELVAQAYLVAKDAIAEIAEQQNRVKEMAIAVLDVVDQDKFRTDKHGTIVWMAPAVTVRYDTKKLDAVCQVLPEIAKAVTPFRIEGQRKGYVKVSK